MRIRLRDWVATLLVAAIVVPYVGYLVSGSMPFIRDATSLGAVGIVLGLVAVSVIGPDAFRGPWGRTAAVTGIVAVLLGVATALVGATWAAGGVLLACFVAAIVLTWLIAVLVDVRVLGRGHRDPAHR